MDPFIEGCGLWGDFHDALIQSIKKTLNQNMPARYLARTGERGYVVLARDDNEQKRAFIPDVGVSSRQKAPEADGNVALAEPVVDEEPYSLQAFIEEEFRETFVEILDAENDGRLVTCIEILSPSNKKPNTAGWDLYQRKRQGLLQSGAANLIEIDLLRGGVSMPMAKEWRASPYRLLVARKNRAPLCLVWSAFSLQPIRAIPVPLLNPDPDVLLELQSMIDAIYAEAKYAQSIDYNKPITPPLSADEKAWLAKHLQVQNPV